MDFGNPIDEHLYTRKYCTVFDLSHMGRILVSGEDSSRLLNRLIAKDLTKAREGFMFGPTAFLNERAGFVDDVMLYYMEPNKWLIVCNAINIGKVIDWIQRKASELNAKNVSIDDLTSSLAMIAVQGPESQRILSKALGLDLKAITHLQFWRNISVNGKTLYLISRSGWTGEDGFELIGEPELLARIFERLISLGAKPAGLIARDSLRIEMGYCLYGNEIDENITPIEARYWVFDLSKSEDYVGKHAIVKKLEEGVERIRFGIRMKKGIRLIPRKGYKVYVLERVVGYVTSGTFSPILNRCIAQAYIESRYAIPGLEVHIEIRGKLYPGKIVDFPFIKL